MITQGPNNPRLRDLRDVSAASPTVNDLLYYSGSAWALRAPGELGQFISYLDLLDQPTSFPPSAHTHVVADISDFPALATVATTGSYDDLIDLPTIPTVNYSTDTRIPFMQTGAFDYNDRLTFSSLTNILQVGSTSTTGYIQLRDRGQLRLHEDNGNNYIALRAQSATFTSNFTFDLPASYGSSGQVLSTDGAGVLSWADPSTGGASTLAGLDDVDVSGAEDGDTLRYIASADTWIAAAPEAGGAASLSLGAQKEIPFVNSATDDLEYDSEFTFDPATGKLEVDQGLTILNNQAAVNQYTAGPLLGGSLDAGGTPAFLFFKIASSVFCAFQGQTTCSGNFGILGAGTLSMTNAGGFVTTLSSSAVTASRTYTLPPTDGASGSSLVTNGSAALSWKSSRGTSFPGSPADGDTFYRTDLDCLFVYDGSAWLSVETWTNGAGYSGTMAVSTDFGSESGAGFGSNRGYRVPFNCRLSWLTLQNNLSDDFDIEVRVNNSTSTTLSVSASRGEEWTGLSVALSAGDYLGFRNASTSNELEDPMLFFGLKRVAT